MPRPCRMLVALLLAITCGIRGDALASRAPRATAPARGPSASASAGTSASAHEVSSCRGALCFQFDANWTAGGPATTLPTFNFSVRKLEAFVYPPDGRTYAYADIVNFSDPYYPVSYSSEVGVFSSDDGLTGWQYHGIVVPRGAPGAWDSAGIASPGAAVATDGTVLVGWAGEHDPSGGNNRGIGLSSAPHPLGPFTKHEEPVASPHGVCGGSGRCDDVIMQSRPDGVHLWHSVKSSDIAAGCDNLGTCIRHLVTRDAGKTWSNSTIAISRRGGMETFAGKWFPRLRGGQGAMVLITDGGPDGSLTPFISDSMGEAFVPAEPSSLTTHPPVGKDTANPGHGARKGDWAGSGQIGLIPDAKGDVVAVSYSQYTGKQVWCARYKESCGAYTHTVYPIKLAV